MRKLLPSCFVTIYVAGSFLSYSDSENPDMYQSGQSYLESSPEQSLNLVDDKINLDSSESFSNFQPSRLVMIALGLGGLVNRRRRR